MLTWYEQALLITSLMLLMLGVGASLEPQAFRTLREHPKRVLLGFFAQFGWMPLLAFLFSRLIGASPEVTLALVMIGSTPGGSTSNIFAYYARADLPLSIGMTIASSFGALIMMPVMLWLYLDSGEHESIVIPFKNIVISLASILVPILMGLFFRFRSPTLGVKLERLGNRAGLFAAVLMVFIWGPDFVSEIRWDQLGLYSVFFLLFFAGILSGLLTAKLFKLPEPACRAVSLETGIQNCPLTLTIMTLSFPVALVDEIGWIPVTYGTLSVGLAGLTAASFHLIAKRSQPPQEKAIPS